MKKILRTMLVLVALGACEKPQGGATYQTTPVKIIGAAGTYNLSLEVAKTEEEKARGLMFRETLAPDAGMIFLYPKPQKITMWMKNTPLSLDMVFVGSDHKISGIITNTEPFSERLIESEDPAIAVIEFNAGTAKRLGLAIGDVVEAAVLAPPVE